MRRQDVCNVLVTSLVLSVGTFDPKVHIACDNV